LFCSGARSRAPGLKRSIRQFHAAKEVKDGGQERHRGVAPLRWRLRPTGKHLPQSVVRQVDFDPALDLTEKLAERILAPAGSETRLAHVVERPRVVFEVLGQLLKQQEASLIQG